MQVRLLIYLFSKSTLLIKSPNNAPLDELDMQDTAGEAGISS